MPNGIYTVDWDFPVCPKSEQLILSRSGQVKMGVKLLECSIKTTHAVIASAGRQSGVQTSGLAGYARLRVV